MSPRCDKFAAKGEKIVVYAEDVAEASPGWQAQETELQY